MSPRRTQALLLFIVMIVVTVAVGGADVARALFGLAVVLGVMLAMYYVLLRGFDDG